MRHFYTTVLLSLEVVVGFALRSSSVFRTLPEGECEAETPTHMSIHSVHDCYSYRGLFTWLKQNTCPSILILAW